MLAFGHGSTQQWLASLSNGMMWWIGSGSQDRLSPLTKKNKKGNGEEALRLYSASGVSCHNTTKHLFAQGISAATVNVGISWWMGDWAKQASRGGIVDAANSLGFSASDSCWWMTSSTCSCLRIHNANLTEMPGTMTYVGHLKFSISYVQSYWQVRDHDLQ